MNKLTQICMTGMLIASTAVNASTPPVDNFKYSVDKFADIEILRYRVPDFDKLSLKQKELIYFLNEAALEGRLASWAATAEGAVAQIIVLDQFTRNTFRDTPRAFAGDARALKAAQALIATGTDRKLPGVYRQFAYLPFEHAEDLSMQNESMRSMTSRSM